MKLKFRNFLCIIFTLNLFYATASAKDTCEILAETAVINLRSLNVGASPIQSIQVNRNSEQPPTNGGSGCDQVYLVVQSFYKNYFKN